MDTTRKIERIIFSDNISEIDKASELSATLFIAMNPRVMAYLMKRGLPAHNTLQYIGKASRANMMEKSKILTEWLEKNMGFSNAKTGLWEAQKSWFIFLTRFSINYCLWSIEIILNAIDAHQPEEICNSSSVRQFVYSVCIEPEEKYLGYLTSLIAQKKNLKYDDLSSKRSASHGPSIIPYLLKYMAFRLWEKFAVAKKVFCRKKEALLFTTKLYRMDRLAQELQKQVETGSYYFLKGPLIPSFDIPNFIIKVFWRNHYNVVIAQKKFFKNLESTIKNQTDLFSYRDIQFAHIISQKLQDNIAPYIIGQALWSFELERFLNSLRPKTILSNGDRPDDMLLAEIAQKKNITTIFVSHGSYVVPKNKYEHTEWEEHGRAFLRGTYTYHALQSPLAEGYLNTFSISSKIIKTGPLIWGVPVNLESSRLLFKKLFGNKCVFGDIKVVLHAGTSKSSNILRFHIYETPDEYIQALCDIADAVEKIPKAILIIKFRPTSEIGIDNLKRLVPFSEKVILSVDESFMDLLGMSNLLVSFSSTTIEEALQNRIPVLLYGGSGRYQHVSAYEINSNLPIRKSAVYHVRESKNLRYALDEILGLNKNAGDDETLFSSYIYAKDARTSLADLLKQQGINQ